MELGDGGFRARGSQVAEAHRLEYELVTDAALVTELLVVTAEDARGRRRLELRRHASGDWIANGKPVPAAAGALDCDLALSPLTNYMPAARLGARPADHVMAWVSVPDLGVMRSEQRYEPIDERRVRYVGLDHDFTAELELDDDGLVLRYPGLAERA